MPIDPREFRTALSAFATGVTVITARDPAGSIVGVTANSFNSVSLDPPLVLWSLSRGSRRIDAYRTAEYFAVNVLSADQVSLANRFAKSREDTFDGVEYTLGAGDAPLLEGCAARFQCRKSFEYEGGDHLIFVGEVQAFDNSGRSALVFHKGSYAVSEPHPAAIAGARQGAAGGFIDDYLDYLLTHAAHAFKRQFQPLVDRAGHDMFEWFVLANLSDRDDQTLQELTRETLMSEEMLIGVLRRMEARDLVTGRTDEWDGYRERFRLTHHGSERVVALLAAAKAHEADALGEFSADEARALKDALRRLLGWLRSARATAPGATEH